MRIRRFLVLLPLAVLALASCDRDVATPAVLAGALVTPARSYTYDALGLPAGAPDERDGLGRALELGDARLEWGADGQLAAVVSGAGARTEYIHDEHGQRIAWRLEGAVVGADVDGVRLAADSVEQLVSVGVTVVGRLRDGRFELLPLDLRGSATEPTPAAPFGERAQRPGFAALIDFAGGFADPALASVRLGVRDYDPATRRFLGPDPLFLEQPARCVASPVECGLYGYARNQPADYVDHGGTIAEYNGFSSALHVDWEAAEAIRYDVWKQQQRTEIAGQHLVVRYDSANERGLVRGVLQWRAVDETVLAEFAIRSGNSTGKGALPPRTDFTVSGHKWERHDKPGYVDPNGHGWTLAVEPEMLTSGYGQGRGEFRIHPDGGNPGTNGCLGLTDEDTVPLREWFQQHFEERDRMGAPHMSLTVDASPLGELSPTEKDRLFNRSRGKGPAGE